MARSQQGYDLDVNVGEAVTILQAEPAFIRSSVLKYAVVMVPRAALLSLVPDIEQTSTRLIPRTADALRLLNLSRNVERYR